MSHDKPVWTEGMMLRPQHFQQHDRHYEHQLNLRTQLLGPFNTGFFNLELSQAHLRQGKLSIQSASGVLSDGSLFDIGHAHSNLVLDIPKNTQGMSVYLGLPLVGGGAVETRPADMSEVLSRHISHEENVHDSNAEGNSQCSIRCSRPDFRLLLGDAHHDAFVKLKVCQILGIDNSGEITLDDRYAPSYLHIKAAQNLQACVQNTLNQLNSRGQAIAGRMNASHQVAGAELGDFMMLQLINRSELCISQALEMGRLHPYEIHRHLLALLGDLSVFANARRPTGLKALFYDHDDQLGCFQRLQVQISEVLSKVLEQHAVELPLEQKDYGIQLAHLRDRSLVQSSYFVLVAHAQGSAEALRSRLPEHLKIGSIANIRDKVNRHLPGIKLTPLPVAPRQIPYDPRRSYFKLEVTPEELSELERSSIFALHVSGEFAALELNLWAIRN
ncbi:MULTISPECIES: type VI secretion system baseplate subunit TssK [unclassified Pseudomonas]|uniref:type VI secretion system baseplate subunit TssK n=1 Tax=unclassified Pseudomonas TaxID=196821 RepID=UPI00128DAD0E|nr:MULTISPECIES: type VI secretion system baseplate subunit TssK [unclassified Pseudomonas]MPQ71087.1 type VI secretion system baseplate subunit TssK [Pseudomonas sp. MWU12-2323]